VVILTEYAKIHNRARTSAREMAQRGRFQTAQKIGRDWVIDSEEPYPDNRKTKNIAAVYK
jgi:hypothetical protein